jgi:negative regulator of genetic competence, sporulation and motility
VIFLEFLLIGESKIKIVLTPKEADEFGLQGVSADVGSHIARRAFWRVLDRARAEVGFDPSGDKVLIQLYPTADSGCEIFVTKLGILSDSSARLVARSDRVTLLSRKQGIYAFECLDDLISASRAVRSRLSQSPPPSDVYSDGTKYYLVIEEYGKGGESIEFPCVLEFATCLATDSIAYICEHAARLTDGDAIDRFSTI